MTITDETLMAYVDDELDAAERAAVEAAMARNPELAQRVTRQQELRRRVRDAFDRVVEEPVPDRLVDAARRAPAGMRDPIVTDLTGARAERKDRIGRRWSWPEWSAMAASVALGVVLSQVLFRPFAIEPIVVRDGRLLAQDALARALSNQLSAEQSANASIAMGPSFRSREGTLCRTFVIRDVRSLAGLACREGDRWPVELVVPGGEAAGTNSGLAMAGAKLPTALLRAVEERIEGEPLDAEAEAAARRDQWR